MFPRFVLKLFIGLTLLGLLTLIVIFTSSIVGTTRSSLQVINNVRFYSDHLYQYLNNGNIKGKINIISTNLTESIDKASFRQHNDHANETRIVKKEELKPSATFKEVPAKKEDKEKEKTIAPEILGKKSELPLCSERGENLVGPLFVDQTIPKDMHELEREFSIENGGTVEKGGWWSPTTCKPRKKVAIIIPYRKRIDQLKVFLKHMHPFLRKQLLHYRIFVVEQLYEDPFNRAALFNIGFKESLKRGDFDCFIFTDVDLIPEDDRNHYGCPTSPRHMSVAVDKFSYRLPYARIFGGVGAFTRDHFEEVNGMSNLFFGWGGEDDDLYQRITEAGWKLSRPSEQIGRYTMLSVGHHQSSRAGSEREILLRSSKERMMADGLNTLKYNLKKVLKKKLFTVFKVAIIIPFRRRFEQLRIFLRHMHGLLQRQQIYYRIIVVEQVEEDPFNRAGLFNVGFVEALKLTDFNCFVFSDVDLLPEDDRNYYGCPTSPRHMSIAVDKFNYKLPYATIFGGVGAFTREDFEKVNGFSNLYFGWGGEDDDLYRRIVTSGFKLTRPSLQVGRYTMIRIHHVQSSKANPNRGNLLKNSGRRMNADGLNTLKYDLVKIVEEPLVTFFRVRMKQSMYS